MRTTWRELPSLTRACSLRPGQQRVVHQQRCPAGNGGLAACTREAVSPMLRAFESRRGFEPAIHPPEVPAPSITLAQTSFRFPLSDQNDLSSKSSTSSTARECFDPRSVSSTTLSRSKPLSPKIGSTGLWPLIADSRARFA
jgi:hypothetical protein